MSRLRTILLSWSFAVAVSCLANDTAVAQMGFAAPAAAKPNVVRQPENLFAIIGQVARPGVYRAPHAEPYLIDLVHNAGGFSKQATGYLQIVRQGPSGPESFYANGHDFQLRPGDVVIAGKELELTINPQPTVRQGTPGAGENIEAAQVQLAFVNLVDRPIVLKMQQKNATVGRILELLGQSPELARTVRVIAPPSSGEIAGSLASESVLVFDRSVLQAARFPALPLEIVNDTRHNEAGITTVHSEAVEEPVASDEQLRMAARNAVANATTREPIDLEPPVISPAGTRRPAPLKTASLPKPAVPQPAREAEPVLPVQLTSANDPLTPPAAEEDEATGSGWLGLLVYGFLASGVCGAAGWGGYRQLQKRLWSLPMLQKRAATPDTEPLDLNEIIYDQLPVVEEPTSPADAASVFVRVERSAPLRVDAAQGPPRPHFLPNRETTKERQPVQAAAVPDVSATVSGGRKFRLDADHELKPAARPESVAGRPIASEPKGLLDRVLSRVQGAAD